MGKNKLKHFAEVLTFPNVFQLTREMKGKWDEQFFKNGNPITLELACGRGEYTLGLGGQYPDRNFIGVDIKGARLWQGGKNALEKEMKNVAFLRTQIDHLAEYFEPGEATEIWITFPDPYPQLSNAKRRLTSPKYLEVYKQVLKPGGILHLKTDDTNLYEFTLEVLAAQKMTILFHTSDLYAAPLPNPILGLKTYYEKIHLAAGKTIKYIQFKF